MRNSPPHWLTDQLPYRFECVWPFAHRNAELLSTGDSSYLPATFRMDCLEKQLFTPVLEDTEHPRSAPFLDLLLGLRSCGMPKRAPRLWRRTKLLLRKVYRSK